MSKREPASTEFMIDEFDARIERGRAAAEARRQTPLPAEIANTLRACTFALDASLGRLDGDHLDGTIWGDKDVQIAADELVATLEKFGLWGLT